MRDLWQPQQKKWPVPPLRLLTETLKRPVSGELTIRLCEADEALWDEYEFERRYRFATTTKKAWVYFAQDRSQRGGLIKIGKTITLWYRLQTISKETGRRLASVGQFVGSLLHEKAVHRVFAEDRERGEWFRPSPLLCELIEAIGHESVDGSNDLIFKDVA